MTHNRALLPGSPWHLPPEICTRFQNRCTEGGILGNEPCDWVSHAAIAMNANNSNESCTYLSEIRSNLNWTEKNRNPRRIAFFHSRTHSHSHSHAPRRAYRNKYAYYIDSCVRLWAIAIEATKQNAKPSFDWMCVARRHSQNHPICVCERDPQ